MKKFDLNILNYYLEKRNENEYEFLRGHLYLEALMVELLRRHSSIEIPQTFYKKINELKNLKLIDSKTYDVLYEINKMRNDIAHNLEFDFSYKRFFKIIKLATEAKVDFSDSSIYFEEEVSKENYGIDGVISELFYNVFEHLIYNNPDLFLEDGGVSFFS